jgi:hypothetical protein
VAVFKIDPIPVEDRNKKIERDDDSKKSHRALARLRGFAVEDADFEIF